MSNLWTRYLIALGQSLEQKWGLGFNTPETTDKYINAPASDGYHIEAKEDTKD